MENQKPRARKWKTRFQKQGYKQEQESIIKGYEYPGRNNFRSVLFRK